MLQRRRGDRGPSPHNYVTINVNVPPPPSPGLGNWGSLEMLEL